MEAMVAMVSMEENEATRGHLCPCSSSDPRGTVVRASSSNPPPIVRPRSPVALLLPEAGPDVHEGLAEQIQPPAAAVGLGVGGREADAPDAIEGAGLDQLAVAGAQQPAAPNLSRLPLRATASRSPAQASASKPATLRPRALALRGALVCSTLAAVSSSPKNLALWYIM